MLGKYPKGSRVNPFNLNTEKEIWRLIAQVLDKRSSEFKLIKSRKPDLSKQIVLKDCDERLRQLGLPSCYSK